MSKTKKSIVISFTKDVSEIIDLAETLDYNVIKKFIQIRKKPDVKSYIGKGKVNEIKEYLEETNEKIDLIIVDGKLKPSQWFHLEKKFKVEVYDRIRLILKIFENRAERKEARLQVKLAQLEYERPFVRELIHRARSGEHPGLMAGGEYQVDDYYEMIKKQMKKIKQDLQSIRQEREIRRRHRHVGGFYLVSLAGYTNAGKSSLLNYLSSENVKVEGKLFSTLSTTTRRLKNNGVPVLITDTVGFIQDLPALIVDAFHSTLEEIEVADVILLVVDVSKNIETVENKLKVSLDELTDIGVSSPVIVVFNKIDLLSDDEIKYRKFFFEESEILKDKKIVFTSVREEKNMDVLLDLVFDSLPDLTELSISLPFNEGVNSFVSWVHDKAFVLDSTYGDNIVLCLECAPDIRGKIVSRCLDLGGKVIG